jgi:DUF1009 family protein
MKVISHRTNGTDEAIMRIGLIAGSGKFPIIFSQTAKKHGFEVYAIAYRKETDPALQDYVDGIEWINLGQIKRMVSFFKLNQVTEAVMLGAVCKTKLFSDLRPDTKALALIARVKHTHDDGFLRAFAGLMEKEGITIRASTFLVPDLLAPEGCWTKRKPSKNEWDAIELGWEMAKEIGRLDIGQCVVVGSGSVLAVEAVDGTDATIRRGGKLGNGESVVVKVCKPNQDTRFDIPAIGARTIQTMYEAGVGVLAIEAGKAVVFDRDEMVELANRLRISIVALNREN